METLETFSKFQIYEVQVKPNIVHFNYVNYGFNILLGIIITEGQCDNNTQIMMKKMSNVTTQNLLGGIRRQRQCGNSMETSS